MKNTINIKGLNISYIEQNPFADKILFFIHGNSSSANSWYKKFESNLFQDYRLIAFDLPGHGNSSHSSDPATDYSLVVTSQILSQAVKELAHDIPYILVGFSYGTNLIAEMLNFNLYPKGIVMIGMCCIGTEYGMDKVFKQSEQPSIFFYNETRKEIASEFIKQSIFSSDEIEVITNDYFNTDINFRPFLIQAVSDGKFIDEVLNIQNYNLPVCIIFGSQDNIVNTGYLNNSTIKFWNGRINIIDNSGHYVHLDNPEKVNKLIADYAGELL